MAGKPGSPDHSAQPLQIATTLRFRDKAKLAEEISHHPDIFLAWGKVKITIWTHKIDGLNEADFIFAAKADALAS